MMNRCASNFEITNLDRVPVLSGEGVDSLLLEALLALGESLVPGISRKPIAFIAARRR